MSDPLEEFDDPSLKSAIRNALGSERAPATLRQRVMAMQKAQSRPPGWRVPRRAVYALAAVLVVGLGLAAILMSRTPEATVPDWFADAMITSHDTLKTLADNRPIPRVDQNDLPGLRQRLLEITGHPALVAMLGADWKFNGAGICDISQVPAAHLMFSNGDDTISIFSISANLIYSGPSQDGKTYSQSRNGHELAGFVYGGAIHCLVARSPTKKIGLKQIVAMRDRIRGTADGFSGDRPPLQINR